MTTRMVTALSRNEDSAAAAKEVASRVLEQIEVPGNGLAILYCSSYHHYPTVLATLRAQLGESIPLIGASTAGEFAGEDVARGSVALGLIVSDEMRFFTDLAVGVGEELELAVARFLVRIAPECEPYAHQCVFILSDGLAGNGEEITLMISNLAGQNACIVGGLAADDFKMERTVVFHNDVVTDKAAAICVMASQKPFVTAVNHGHLPMTEPMRISRAEGSVLFEVNGRPAWDLWKERSATEAAKLGIDVTNVEERSQVGAFLSNFELGLSTGGGAYKVRYPMSKNPDGSMNFTCTIPQGAMMCIMDGKDKIRQIDAARHAALQARQAAEEEGLASAAGALVVECAVRQFLLGDDFPKAPAAMREVLGDIPMLGGEAYGEMRMEPGEFSGYHNTTTVLLLLPA